MYDDHDCDVDELRADARAARRPRGCQCGSDLPGTCPGVQNCPYSDYHPDQDEE